MTPNRSIYDYLVIGAGQAGLAISYYLSQQKKDFLVVDAYEQVGQAWLNRWDSLTLFTPTEYNHLPGFPFNHPKGYYPNKYEVAEYLQNYVTRFQIPVKHNQKITHLEKQQDYFVVSSEHEQFFARHVIIATGPFHTPFIPSCAQDICADITQIHSEHYKSPAQLCDGDTLVVGAGDSGVQILEEVSNTNRKVYFSGSDSLTSIPQEFLGKTLWWWFSKIGFLTVSKYSWIGKKLSTSLQPIIGTDVKALLARDNVISVGRTLSASERNITFEKTQVNTIKNIIWATGYKPNFSWIQDVSYDDVGYPSNFRGISSDHNKLAFIGLPWMYTRGSATLGGVYKDAKYLADNFI